MCDIMKFADREEFRQWLLEHCQSSDRGRDCLDGRQTQPEFETDVTKEQYSSGISDNSDYHFDSILWMLFH